MLEVAEEALELAEQLDDPVRQVQALWLLWDWRNVYGGEEYAVADKFRRLLDTSSALSSSSPRLEVVDKPALSRISKGGLGLSRPHEPILGGDLPVDRKDSASR